MADIVYTYFSTETNIKIIGFVVDGKFIKEDKFNGVPVVALEDIKKAALKPKNKHYESFNEFIKYTRYFQME